ncbi:hypothetical protein OROGR_012164 [Orobanche gracilis]
MSREKLESRFWYEPNVLFNPWRRSFDRIRSGIFFAKVNHFGKFDDYVDVNKHLDWNTKRAALDASPFVVALTSHIGCQRLFICSGTIVNSYGANGEFFGIILTSATLLRCPTTEDSLADDIKKRNPGKGLLDEEHEWEDVDSEEDDRAIRYDDDSMNDPFSGDEDENGEFDVFFKPLDSDDSIFK